MEPSEKITIQATVDVPVSLVWKYWTTPEDIVQWNAASPDWHTLKAEINLHENGRFSFRMEAKDKSFGFDFGGTFNVVVINSHIEYTLDDNRAVEVHFLSSDDKTEIVEIFEAENENPIDLQRSGWQSILNNFKRYAETEYKRSKQ
jgi:uncharacterized protein YndB with AHSA1/START domain